MRRRSEAKAPQTDDNMDDRSSMSEAREGDRVSYTWGSETIQAVEYNACGIGPFSLEVIVQEFETHAQAYERARAACERMARDEFTRKVQAHLDRIELAHEMARERARGRR